MKSTKGKAWEGTPGPPAPFAPKKPLDLRLLLAAGGIIAVLIIILAVGLLAFSSSGGSTLGGIGQRPSGIAIIPIKGEISNEGSGGALGGPASHGSDEVVAMIEDAQKNSDVGAILLDIDSPGGEVVASKQIVYTIRDSNKPVYSYIGSMGASGAYYVAASTGYIMADRDSITGSIGVISVVPDLNGLLGKLGVRMNVLKQGEHKDIGSPFREMTAADRAIFESVLSQIYEGFKDDVLSFRGGKISRSQLEEIADGRILSGSQAYDARLVDELVTTRRKAIGRAAALAGIGNPHEIPYERKSFSLADLFFSAGESFGSGFVSSIRVSAYGQTGHAELK